MWQEKLRKLQAMRASLSFFLNRELAKGWNGWFSLYQEALHKKASMGGALRHMMNRELSKGWKGWFAMWQEKVHAASVDARFTRLLHQP